jgi:hypothetical protein
MMPPALHILKGRDGKTVSFVLIALRLVNHSVFEPDQAFSYAEDAAGQRV